MMQARRESKPWSLPAGKASGRASFAFAQSGGFDPFAGSKGVEPLIEVLETSVIPFNYEPNRTPLYQVYCEKEINGVY